MHRANHRALRYALALVSVTAILVVGTGRELVAQDAPATSPSQSAPPAPAAPSAQTPPSPSSAAGATAPPGRERLVQRVPPDQFATLRVANRDIATFRASIVPRDPTERVEGARRIIDRLVENNVTGPVSARPLFNAAIITVAGRDVFALVPDDVDEAGEEDMTQLTAAVVARLGHALQEATEARTPARLARAAVFALLATALLVIALIALIRLNRRVVQRVWQVAQKGLERTVAGANAEQLRTPWLADLVRSVVRVLTSALALGFIYAWAAYVLQLFPVTRPWGEALGGYLVATLERLGWGAITAFPGLFTVLVILVCARIFVRLAGLLFDAIDDGRLPVSGLHGPRVLTTRRLVTTLMWLFAIVVAYPYMPGSNTDAFKGVSVFIGLVISLGSTGVVNQLMSGFMLTYSDAIAPGDYVLIGDVEGKVTSLGVLSTKILTRLNEEITVPNAVVISGSTTNFTRHAAEGVYARIPLTIGYDAPWRQVEALLLLAASRSPGLRSDRPPAVLQTKLDDFYVEYTLLICLADPSRRQPTLAGVRAQIQDAFNEHGVQIMSPHYENDPESAKVVPPSLWYQTPARAPGNQPPAGEPVPREPASTSTT